VEHEQAQERCEEDTTTIIGRRAKPLEEAIYLQE
jgi:hypothetical protein